MPLIYGKSKATQNKNIAKEVESGKPLKQAVAISYSIKREAQNKEKK